ncbi:hypothetical protein CU048_08345 [Beijerinckiaceae bacterium]|nr:hypothetical protein CU048_08345 [Beijerinckiaceae bacterium]
MPKARAMAAMSRDQAPSSLDFHAGPKELPSSPQQLPLSGKSVLVIEDEMLIAMCVEACLGDAGVAMVRIANSLVLARRILDEGIRFDAAIVDLYMPDGNASPLVQLLSARGVPVVITTGDPAGHAEPALTTAAAILQKPRSNGDLIKAVIGCMVGASH